MGDQSKHTPGPWKVKAEFPKRGNKRGVIWVTDKDDFLPIARIVVSDGTTHRHSDIYMANARLIEATPELLDACKSALELQEWICEKISKIRQAVDNGQAVESIQSYEELTLAMNDGFLASHRDQYEQAIAKSRGES